MLTSNECFATLFYIKNRVDFHILHQHDEPCVKNRLEYI